MPRLRSRATSSSVSSRPGQVEAGLADQVAGALGGGSLPGTQQPQRRRPAAPPVERTPGVTGRSNGEISAPCFPAPRGAMLTLNMARNATPRTAPAAACPTCLAIAGMPSRWHADTPAATPYLRRPARKIWSAFWLAALAEASAWAASAAACCAVASAPVALASTDSIDERRPAISERSEFDVALGGAAAKRQQRDGDRRRRGEDRGSSSSRLSPCRR